MNQNYSKNRATIYLFIGAFLISFSSVFVKIADVGPIAAGFYRLFIAGVFLLCFWIFKKGKTQNSLKKFLLIIVCAILFAIDLTLWHKSIHYIGPGFATILANLQVFFLAFFSLVFLKEKPSIKFFISVFFIIIGMLLLIGPSWGTQHTNWKWGVLFGILTAVAYTFYILTINEVQKEQNFINSVWNIMLISMICSFIMAGEVLYTNETFKIPNIKSLSAMLCYGLFCQVLGWLIISKNISKVKITTVGLILLLQPSLSFLWDILFFSRPTTFVDLFGVFFTLTGIYFGTIRNA